MNKRTTNILMTILLMISSLAVFVGVLFELQQWPYANTILMTGLISFFLIGRFEIRRLKRIISLA